MSETWNIIIESWAIQSEVIVNNEPWFSYSWVKQDYLNIMSAFIIVIIVMVFFYALGKKFSEYYLN